MRFFLFGLLALMAVPVQACEAAFRAGAVAFSLADRTVTMTEMRLYNGVGWVTREAVLDRLENYSERTTACDEVTGLRADLGFAQSKINETRMQFTRALYRCTGENRRRAQRNLEALEDTAQAISVQDAYLVSLSNRCGD